MATRLLGLAQEEGKVSDTSVTFDEWLTRIRARDEQAARVLLDRFTRALICKAEENLDRRLLSKIDPEDIVQSVLRTFCCRIIKEEFRLVDWGDLWGLLATITLYKCHKYHDQYLSRKRDVQREQPIDTDIDDVPGFEPMARDPGPGDAETFREALDKLLSGLKDLEQRIVQMRLEDPEIDQARIASQLGCSPSKVSRVLNFVKDKLSRMREE
jgi:RNA polymerase sigma-70 factor, ECF subfamily